MADDQARAEKLERENQKDAARADRGKACEQFVQSDFFREEFLPLIERHFTMWLDAVIHKKAGPETLEALQTLIADIDNRIKLGQHAARRLTERRFKQVTERAA